MANPDTSFKWPGGDLGCSQFERAVKHPRRFKLGDSLGQTSRSGEKALLCSGTMEGMHHGIRGQASRDNGRQ
jgi:hypothetical protein